MNKMAAHVSLARAHSRSAETIVVPVSYGLRTFLHVEKKSVCVVNSYGKENQSWKAKKR